MDLRSAKLIGAIGAILTIFAFIPTIGLLFSIVGFILIALAVKTISDTVREEKIFKDYIVALALSVVSAIILLISGLTSLYGLIGLFTRDSRLGLSIWGWSLGLRGLIGLLLSIVAWVIFIIATYYMRSSFDEISNKLAQKHFKNAGLFLFIGAILLIVFGFGLLFILIGVIFEIIAFLSIPDALEKQEIPKAA